ncbi:GP88 family protein [Bacillus paranthracis]|uniref:GP88 family protein n=1 Tax=Bacillus paranthracis TaxID=2026186 RepID=UPI002D775775|nr:hypothetical protein [Bacillus paranthracis]
MTLLTTQNAKTIKGEKKGFNTGIVYLAPFTNGGMANLCPMAEMAQCNKACLYTAGRGAFDNVQAGRIRKAVYFQTDYNGFMNELAWDINRHVNKSRKAGSTPLIRLNGTSDIIWERKGFTLDEQHAKRIGKPAGYYENMMALFSDVQFYDYTKIAGRFNGKLPANYDLTFSYSGVAEYQKQVQHAMKKGARIAVVFRDKEKIPTEFMGMECVDGDDTDIRHIEPQGVVVALYAKGQARKDKSGFVVDIA